MEVKISLDQVELANIVEGKDFNEYLKKYPRGILNEISSLTGLSGDQVEENKNIYGNNILPTIPIKSFLYFLLKAASDRILIMLSIAAIISLFVNSNHDDGWIEGAAIFCAVIIVILVNSINDWRKDRLFNCLNKKNQDGFTVKVRRSDKSSMILSSELTIGDVIILEPGDIIPADAIFFSVCTNLICDESSATGESQNVKKNLFKDPFLLSGTKLLDVNFLFKLQSFFY
jgi:Ca2+-transporting ATPase